LIVLRPGRRVEIFYIFMPETMVPVRIGTASGGITKWGVTRICGRRRRRDGNLWEALPEIRDEFIARLL
jgi:hypothetical protein